MVIRNKSTRLFIICCVCIVVLLAAVVSGLLLAVFDDPLKDLNLETDTIPAFVNRGTLYTENGKTHLSQICKKQNKNYSLKEVFCIADEKVYFVCSDADSSTNNWIIASVDLGTSNYEEHFVFSDAQKAYRANRAPEYSNRCGYYYDGKIVLNDLVTVLDYDINTGDVKTSEYDKYNFYEPEVYGSYIDAHTIELIIGDSKKTFTLEEMAKSSDGIAALYSLNDKKIWDGKSHLPGFFSQTSIQEVGEKIYAVGSVLNYLGESYAVVLEYENGSWRFVSNYFSGDTVHTYCYVIEKIS